MSKYTIQSLGLAICFGILLVALWRIMPSAGPMTIRPPAEFRDANLRIDVTIGPQVDRQVISASIGCPVFDVPPSWYGGWCGVAPLNKMFQADSAGKIVLWFTVSPSPYEDGIAEGVSSVAKVGIEFLGKGWRAYRPEILEPDHWVIRISGE